MADHGSDYHRGHMDIHEQESTYQLVMGMTKWGSLAIASILLLLVVWFCTSAGFVPGFIAALVLAVLGVVFLRAKPEAAAH